MSWARFDDQYSDNPKILEAGAWCELLDMRAIIYCARQLTDGRISPTALKRISHGVPAVPKKVLKLVEVGRWEVHPNGGWLVHAFLEFNPCKATVEKQRAAGKERQAKFRENQRNGVTRRVTTALGSTGRDGNLLEEQKREENLGKIVTPFARPKAGGA